MIVVDPIEYIGTFSRSGARVSGLERIAGLMHALHDPQDKLRFIHIAGTNGKGSMAQMFSEILMAEGHRVGLFTSPYVTTFYERIRVNGVNIPRNELSELFTEIASCISGSAWEHECSQFEIIQAAAFLWFVRTGCDIVVLEAGIGGRFDSTNIISTSAVSAIGSIGLDHTALLGDTVEQIAYQKAGIIKPRIPCVLSAGCPPEAEAVFRREAQLKGSELIIPDMGQCRVTSEGTAGSSFEYKGESYRTAMPGRHQVSNALTVIEAMHAARNVIPVSQRSIAEGIGRAVLPGRTQVLSEHPLIILDGSHNPDGIEALAAYLSAFSGRRIRAVIGMHSDKDARTAVSRLVPEVDSFYPVSGFSDRDIPADTLAGIIRSCGGKAEPAEGSIMQTIRSIAAAHPDDVLVICGSLYLASYVINSAPEER